MRENVRKCRLEVQEGARCKAMSIRHMRGEGKLFNGAAATRLNAEVATYIRCPYAS